MLKIMLCSVALLATPLVALADMPADDARPLLILVDQSSGQPSVGAIIIDEVARNILYTYYQRQLQDYQVTEGPQGNGHKNKNKNKDLPPGLAKKGRLPPGIEKQLVRNGQLPPGLQYRDLPPDLIRQLPPVAPGYRYVILNDRVMLIRAATDLIMDILQVPALH